MIFILQLYILLIFFLINPPIKINIQGVDVKVYIIKRPFVDEFLEYACKNFEVIIFTASIDEVNNI